MKGLVKFIDVLHGAAEMCGLTPGLTLTTEAAGELARHVTRAAGEMKRGFAWPCLECTEERAYRAEWNDGGLYQEGDEVYLSENGKYYRSLHDDNDQNLQVPEDWEEFTPSKYVDMRADGLTPMEAVYGVYDCDPRGKRRPGGRREYRITGRTIAVGSDAPSTVWVVFRRALDKLTTEAWVEATTYVRGDLVFVEDDGDCYTVIVDGVDGDYPPLSTSDTAVNATWAKVELPEEWGSYLTLRAAAYYLFGDGEREAAGQLEADAIQAMNTAMGDVAHNQTQVAGYAAT